MLPIIAELDFPTFFFFLQFHEMFWSKRGKNQFLEVQGPKNGLDVFENRLIYEVILPEAPTYKKVTKFNRFYVDYVHIPN